MSTRSLNSLTLIVFAAAVNQAHAEEPAATTTATATTAPRCRSPDQRIKGDEEKSWSTQFQVYERTKGGDLYPLSDDSRLIDIQSDIVIRRIADDPTAIYTVDSESEYEDVVKERNAGEVTEQVKRAEAAAAAADESAKNAAQQVQAAQLAAKKAKEKPTTGGKKEPQADTAVKSPEAPPKATPSPSEDVACAIEKNDGLDIDVTIFGPAPDQCPTFARVGRIQYSDVFNLYPPRYPDGCRVGLAALTQQRTIAKGTDLIVPAGSYRHGDRVEIQIYGDRIRDFDTIDNCTLNDEKTKRTCDVRHNTTWGQLETVTANVVDYGRLVPMEYRGSSKFEHVISTSSRVDIARDIVVGFNSDNDPVATWLRYGITEKDGGDVVVEATSTLGTESRKLEVKENGRKLTLVGLKPDENVQLVIKRRVRQGDSDAYVEIERYHFAAIARGLHYAFSGDYAARYGTSSALVLHGGTKDVSKAFAQTFAYTFYVRRREPGFLDHFGAGLHFALLAGGDESDPDKLTVGVGGQVTFGANIIHLGGGYDFGAKHKYLLIGIDLPDLVKFIKTEDK